MRFILDAYNIIKSGRTDIFDALTLERQRELLMRLIKENRPQGSANNGVTAVFDGNYEISMSGAPRRAAAGDAEAVYTDGEPADDLIERIVLGLKNRSEATIVTDDKGLIRRLGGTGVKRMSVEEFLERLII